MEILSITTNLSRYGGAQKVLMDVHHGIKQNYPAKIIGFQKFDTLHKKYGINSEEYTLFRNPWQLNNKIVIVHARNILPLIVAIKKLFFLNTKIVYVSHNVYNSFRNFTLFPDCIVSISNKVTENLIQYFGQDLRKITLIYNGIKDINEGTPEKLYNNSNIKILYAARVNEVKRQLQITENLKNSLNKNIEIHFAGTGDDYELLKLACSDLPNFKALGFVENMYDLIKNYDYLMLYSVQEGLPISLIEGVMLGKPLLVNDVGGNLEIGVPGENGIHLQEDWDVMTRQLNDLTNISEKDYSKMSIKSRDIFIQKFQYNTMIKNYCNLIESLN